MARFSQSIAEQQHIARIAREMPFGTIALIKPVGGDHIEGVIRSASVGNNAGKNGVWQYYGEVQIETKGGKSLLIDYLDIENVHSVWSDAKAKEYERLGLIEIVDLPA